MMKARRMRSLLQQGSNDVTYADRNLSLTPDSTNGIDLIRVERSPDSAGGPMSQVSPTRIRRLCSWNEEA
jgi:hypothetical protein